MMGDRLVWHGVEQVAELPQVSRYRHNSVGTIEEVEAMMGGDGSVGVTVPMSVVFGDPGSDVEGPDSPRAEG